MDAVKFLREVKRMCRKHYGCVGCPMRELPSCGCEKISQEYHERTVEIVENWSEENPEEIGKKYIIEIDRADVIGNLFLVKGLDYWATKEELEQLEEYKESEE